MKYIPSPHPAFKNVAGKPQGVPVRKCASLPKKPSESSTEPMGLDNRLVMADDKIQITIGIQVDSASRQSRRQRGQAVGGRRNAMLTPRKKTLQTRFFVFSLVISLCVMALTLGVTYYASFRTIENITTKYLNTYIGYADNTLTERLNSAKLLAHAIAIDKETVQRAVSGKTIEASYDWYIEQKVLKSYLDGMVVDKPYVNKIAVVLNNGRIYQSGSSLLVLRDFRTPWFQNALGASKLQIFYLTDTKGAMRITRPVMSGKAIVGTVFIEISIDTLCEAYRLRPLENVTLLLFAEQEELFYAQGEHTELASLEHIGSRETGYIRLMGSEYFVVRYPSAGGGLVTMGFIKRDNVVKSALELGGQVCNFTRRT